MEQRNENRYCRITHEFEPVFDENSRILILGTLPSVKSRENQFYYGHPQNRFWKVIAKLTESPLPESVEEKKTMLLQHGIAIWDVIASCDIIGSSDSSIRNVVPADLNFVLRQSPVQRIYANGKTAKKLYDKYSRKATGMEITGLPSTSPANAAWTLDRLVESWSVIQEEIAG
jgi:hypoxanthine-DNA glycosylase